MMLAHEYLEDPVVTSLRGARHRNQRRWESSIQSRLITGRKGAPKPNVYNCHVHLSHPLFEQLLSFDEASGKVLKRRITPWRSPPGMWTYSDDIQCAILLATMFRVPYTPHTVHLAVRAVASGSHVPHFTEEVA